MRSAVKHRGFSTDESDLQQVNLRLSRVLEIRVEAIRGGIIAESNEMPAQLSRAWVLLTIS
jgi:hypothetical protein